MSAGWTGKKCPKCKGTGEVDEGARRRCLSCGGTGEEYAEDTKQCTRMVTVVLREMPGGGWHATSVTDHLGGMGFADRPDALTAVHDCLEMAGIRVVPLLGKRQYDALERALSDSAEARKAR